MKGLRLSIIIFATAILALGIGGMAYAFHSGGVAECEGCHSMHSPKTGGSFLLVGTDASSTCLTCHQNTADTGPASYRVSTIDSKLTAGLSPLQRSPGGDFGWLKKTYTYAYGTPAVTYTEDGDIHGHNTVAVDFGYATDKVNTVAPGGTFPSSQLSCASCHDPHGQGRRLSDGAYVTTGAPIIGSGSYDNSATPLAGEAVGIYRLLGSPAYKAMASVFTTYPIAVAPSTYNRSEATTQTRVAYGASGTNTWGNWCASCHPGMHSTGNYVHPVDASLTPTVADNYNRYVKSGDMNGSSATAFTSLVPFAENTGDFTVLRSHARNNDSFLSGPASSDKVMCLSCHRAHASGFTHALRFDLGYEFITKAGQYIGSDNPAVSGSRAAAQHRGRTIAEWQAAYYDRPATKFATYQRVLCNKCHAKD